MLLLYAVVAWLEIPFWLWNNACITDLLLPRTIYKYILSLDIKGANSTELTYVSPWTHVITKIGDNLYGKNILPCNEPKIVMHAMHMDLFQVYLLCCALDPGLEPRSAQTKDYRIGVYCFSTKNAALRRNSKNFLVRNRDNVSEFGDNSICGLLFQWDSSMQMQLSV
jgi:hypothetical protein